MNFVCNPALVFFFLASVCGSLTFTNKAATFSLSSVIIVHDMLSAFIAFVGVVNFHHMLSVFFVLFFVYMSSDNLEDCVFHPIVIFIIMLSYDTLNPLFL